MEEDLFARLPSETTIDILSRLSLRATALSKCVCKPWLDLLESDDFVNSQISKSAAAPALAVFIPANGSNSFKVFELRDEVDDLGIHGPISEFGFPRKASCEGSAGNFLFLRSSEFDSDDLYVCNPITREFIEFRFGGELLPLKRLLREVAYGFGESKVSRQHKVVRLSSKSNYCHVYTLGTGRWRRVEAATAAAAKFYSSAFAGGNIYWLVSDSNYETWICCFDMETERFSTVPCPPRIGGQRNFALFPLRDCLCAVVDDDIMLWLLEECGAEKSWMMAYGIEQHPDPDAFGYDCFQPIKVLKNGDILTLCDWKTFYRYNPIAEFDFPRRTRAIGGSVNGLLLLHRCDANVDASYVCNPITREFVEIHFNSREEQQCGRRLVAYGFGASNVSGECKLVRIDSGSGHCHVYTLGTRQWRRVGAAGAASFGLGLFYCYGALLNGILYWSVWIADPEHRTLIAWFDLEKECLGTFARPPTVGYRSNVELFALRDSLSFWDESDEGEYVIWVMKECGMEQSWRKEYVIDQRPDFDLDGLYSVRSIKAFENGDILVLCDEKMFLVYSIETKTYQEIPSFGLGGRGGDYINSLLLTPSFRSLKSFGMEDVISF